MEDTFIRELDIELNSGVKTLQLHQKIEGDVSCVVWDASIILAKYLEKLNQENPEYFKNLNVIELGAGVGCVGLTAAGLGANVLLTDLQETVPLLALNVEINKKHFEDCGSVKVNTLDWSKETAVKFPPRLILLADCIYYKESILPLIKTLQQLVTTETKILLSQELRDTEKQVDCWELFLKTIKLYFEVQIIPIEQQHAEYFSNDIVIMKLNKL